MKPSFPVRPSKPLSRSTARNSVLINQFATPGLGSLLAGRWIAGIGQLLLALAGFGMIMSWFVKLMIQIYRDIEGASRPDSVAWLGIAGGLTFLAAWLWALVTSVSLMREARAADAQSPSAPPKLN